MISSKKKFLFVHPQKVGGNTIHNVFKDFYDKKVGGFIKSSRSGKGQGFQFTGLTKHAHLDFFYKKFPETREYYKFSVIRNPWDRMASWYSFYSQKSCEFDTTGFNEWISSGARHLCPLSKFYCYDGSYEMDFLISFENYSEDLKKVYKEIIGSDLKEVPHFNKSKNRNYVDFYKNGDSFDKELITKVERIFSADLKIKEYTFGE